jgi:hypothetical protein
MCNSNWGQGELKGVEQVFCAIGEIFLEILKNVDQST